MAEHQRVTKSKEADADQKHHSRQQDAQPLFARFHSWDQGLFTLAETPFSPRMDEHAALLEAAHSDERRSNLVLHLQRTYGNRYVQRLVESVKAQAKLTVNTPNDVYEQEADRVADVITKAIASPAQRQEEEEEMAMSKPASTIQRQEEEEEPVQMSISHLQRQEIAEDEEVQAKLLSSVQRQEEEEPVQVKAAPETQRQELPEELQGQRVESQAAGVSEDLETRINRARGNGQSLSDTVRGSMEKAFGADFDGVRVHTDSEADEINKQLSARAFTTGQDVFFRQGEYSPGSDSGQKLIAHELTHVVQQTGHRQPPRQVSRKDMGTTAKSVNFGSEKLQSLWSSARPIKSRNLFANRAISTGQMVVQRYVKTNNTAGPAWAEPWSGNKLFNLQVSFNTDERYRWIYQKITNTWNVQDKNGKTTNWQPVPQYWEAWHVDGSGAIDPDFGGTSDFWWRGSNLSWNGGINNIQDGEPTKGDWAMQGDVYVSRVHPRRQGYSKTAVADAHGLWAGLAAPTGISPLELTRTADGSWNNIAVPKQPHGGNTA